MAKVVSTGAKLKTIVVTGELQGRSHLLIRQRPTSGHNVRIELTACKKTLTDFLGVLRIR